MGRKGFMKKACGAMLGLGLVFAQLGGMGGAEGVCAFLPGIHVEAVEKQSLEVDGTPVERSIDEAGKADFYRIILTEPGMLTVVYQGLDIKESSFEVLSSDQMESYGKEEVKAASTGDSGASSRVYTLEAGNYLVKVCGEGGSVGRYRLKATFMLAGNNETEPNNYFQSATPLKDAEPITGLFSQQDELDYYTFALTQPDKIDITVTGRVAQEMFFSLWDENLVQIEEAVILDSTEINSVTHTMSVDLPAGTYYIKCNEMNVHCGR